MNALEEPTIEEEITSINKKIQRQRGLIKSEEYFQERLRKPADKPSIDPKSVKKISVYKAKMNYLEKKLQNLQSLLDEQAAGWEIVFIQNQNDHDEVWNHASPGPNLTKAIPESHKLDLMIHGSNQANSVLSISFLLYQVKTTLVGYQELKSIKQNSLDVDDRFLDVLRSNNMDKLELNERSAKKQADDVKALFQILDPKIHFLEKTLRHYESVLEGYSDSHMFSKFENLGSFLSEGRIFSESKQESPKKGRLSIEIQSIIGISGNHYITVEPYNSYAMERATTSANKVQYIEWDGKEISLDYEDADARTEIELMIYDSAKVPVGALWLRVSDIIHAASASHQDVGSTEIDTWFTIAPDGKIRLRIVYIEYPEQQTSEEHYHLLTDYLRVKLDHDFVRKTFNYKMLCGHCEKYFFTGVQCTKCHMAWQLACLYDLGTPKFIVPCPVSTEEAIRPHGPGTSHQFVPFFNVSANWCCQCGFFLSQGQGNCEGANRRCEKCGLTCHAQCQALVANRCSEKIMGASAFDDD